MVGVAVFNACSSCADCRTCNTANNYCTCNGVEETPNTCARAAAGASPEGVEGADETPLTAACGNGHLACVQALLAAGADVDKASDTGKTPLCAACCSEALAVVEALVAAGADINKPLERLESDLEEEEEMLPLVCAIQAGALDVVRLLLSSGAAITNDVVEAAKDEGSDFEHALEAAGGTVDSE